MKQLLLVLLPLAMAASSCGQDDSFPFWPEMPGDMPGGQQAVADLKDPDLKWSADSFEATLGAQNSYPTLTNTYGVTITYSSSHPEVATVDGSGVVTALSGGSTLISASSTADGTYSASSASYILTVLGGAGNETGSDALSFASTGDPGSDDDISTTAFKGKITVTFSQTGDAAVTGDTYGYVTVDGNKVTVNNTGNSDYAFDVPKNVLMIPRDSIYSFFENNEMYNNRNSFVASWSNSSTSNAYVFNNIAGMVNAMAAVDESKRSANWNKVVLIPVSLKTTSTSSASTSSYYYYYYYGSSSSTSSTVTGLSHNMALTSTKLVKGTTSDSPLKLNVIYSRFK